MKKTGKVGALLAVLLVGAAATAEPQTTPSQPREGMLVTVEWLAQHVADPNLVLLHVGDKAEYEAAHLPGARHVTTRDLAAPASPGGLTLELPEAEAIRSKLEALGVSDTSRIVVYFGKDWVSPTTRVYFTLDYFGLGDRTSILDGGMPAWRALGRPTTAEVRDPVRGSLTSLRPRPELVASADWVREHLESPGVTIVDARLPQFYEGRDPGSMPRAGRIPGAKSIPFSTLVTDSDNKLKDRAALETILKGAGVGERGTVVSYCHIGQQATVVYFAAKYAGRTAKLYDGSWDEWSRRAELPIQEMAPERTPQTRLGLVTPEWLAAHAADADVRVLDVRPNAYDYFQGHVPNAVHLADAALRGPASGMPVQYLDTGLLGVALARAGVKASHKVVLYSDGMDVLGATMTAYVLERLGHREILLLDGGYSAYKAKQATAQEYPSYQAAGYDLTDMSRRVRVTLDEVKALLGKPGVTFVDARPAAAYRGETTVWVRNGHIPGALNVEWRSLTLPDNPHALRPLDDLRRAFESRGIDKASDIVVYCGTSREASLEYAVLKHLLGYPKVRLYEGSWAEYAVHPELSAAKGPEPGRAP